MSRKSPEVRKEQLLDAAIQESIIYGYGHVTRDMVASRVGVSSTLVTKYFGTMTQLKRAIMRKAVKDEILLIIAQGLVVNDNQAKKASLQLKLKATSSIIQ